MPSNLAFTRIGHGGDGFFSKPEIPQFPARYLTLKFKGSTRSNFVQGKAGVENSVGKQEAKI